VSDELLDVYPALRGFSARLGELPRLEVPAGTLLYAENQPCAGLPLLVSGEVRVSRSSGDGRSLQLYRVRPGELCVASCTSLLKAEPLRAHAVAVGPCALRLLAPGDFAAWLDDRGFRDLVLSVFAERLCELTELVDAVAFHRLDQRLAAILLGHGPERFTTHQQLADQLGTVREMVTRLLHRFEQAGWVALSRERIRILDSAALRRQADAM
jgi:CRP/FNR family transcriptional regulator, anaerobic regulatory protein